MTKQLNEAWGKMYKKRLLNEVEETFDTDDDRRERIEDVNSLIRKRTEELSHDKINVAARKEAFKDSLKAPLQDQGFVGLGDKHVALRDFNHAKEVFDAATPQEKDNIINKKGPALATTNDFSLELFLRDFSKMVDQAKATGQSHLVGGDKTQTSKDPKYNHTALNYKSLPTKEKINAHLYPILSVLSLGPDMNKVAELKAQKPDLFQTMLVKLFFEIINGEQDIRSKEEKLANLHNMVSKLKGENRPDKPPISGQEPGESEVAMKEELPMYAGPGRVMPESMMQEQEQKESVVDVTNRGNKLLKESWEKYKQKKTPNKEKPDDFVCFLG